MSNVPEATEASPISAAVLVDVIRRSGLVDVSALEGELCDWAASDLSAGDIAAQLVERELVTSWQARQLLKGRWKGFRLGKYQLLKELGRGGMAKVFLAQHHTLHNRVAIKVLWRRSKSSGSQIQRFLREARAAAQLSHPNIVRVFDVDEEAGRHFLVMEYVHGSSLQDIVDDRGPLAYETAVRWAAEAAHGLAKAHEHGLIHRDVKPANLLIEDGKTCKLSDFGLARASADELEDAPSLTMQHEEKVLGTADYIAPEQAVNSHDVDARADQYSLGCTLYFMLTGRAPFPEGRIVERLTKHCTQEPVDIRRFRPDAPVALLQVIHRLTRKKPEERFADCSQAAAALEDWLTAHQHGAPSNSAAAHVSNPASIAKLSGEKSFVYRPHVDDDMLELAPEDDDPPKRKRPAASSSGLDAALAGAESSGVSGADAFGLDTEVIAKSASANPLEELLGEVELPTLDAGASGSLASFSDVHGSDVLNSGLDAAGSLRDTDASRAMATSPLAGPVAARREAAPAPAWHQRLYASMSRGEYPLWLLIFAGVVLGGILLFIAYSYVSSFIGPPPVERIGE
ncbi:MAG: serine/threonine protein kinase [Planctomycetales bacterium]|nr:serine/threonine protein kinase [Planctomycetales bacterium]